MSATVETLEGLERRITLNLDVPEVEAEVGKRLRKLAKNVKVDGFRPGKAPMSMISARYGSEVRGEVLSDALHKAFISAMDEQKLLVAGYPRYAPAAGSNGSAFEATFEVFPQITIGDIAQVKVNRPIVDVTDADVDRTLEVLRKQRVQFHSVVDREAREGDRVHVDYNGTMDGVPFKGGEAKDFPVILGEGRTLKEFEGVIVGMTPGENKIFELTFPDDYFAKELAEKTATFNLTLKSIHAPQLPDLDDAFVASMGVTEGGVAKLREEVASNLHREAKRRVQAKVKEHVLDGLLAISPFDVPKGLVAIEVRAMMDKAVTDLKARGLKEQDIKLEPGMFEEQAKRRVALSMLLNSMAEQNNITADEAQVRALVDEFAESYEDPSDVVRWYYQNPERLAEVKSIVMEENIVNWVLERAQVTDEPTTLEKLMGNA